jgi:hypothetical protein
MSLKAIFGALPKARPLTTEADADRQQNPDLKETDKWPVAKM